MLSEIVVGLSVLSSAVGALAIDIYAARKISVESAKLNHNNN
jgi:hypothetical protein